MKLFRTVRYPLHDYKGEKEILVELKVEPVDEKLRRYKSNWPPHVIRMINKRMTKIMLNCRPSGRRQLGKLLKENIRRAKKGLSRSNCER
jgi:hypothetical protein